MPAHSRCSYLPDESNQMALVCCCCTRYRLDCTINLASFGYKETIEIGIWVICFFLRITSLAFQGLYDGGTSTLPFSLHRRIP
ncbi:hypothetical protein LY76DRAFT_51940 [Colletotrichum caudatum]|nr:hypothetical protein LY76DRAFT_51940 [Colletotrichum caudatum]